MKTSRILVLTLAVAAAGGAFVVAQAPKPAPVAPVVAQAPAPAPLDDVLVAGRDVAPGTVVADADLSWQPWPKNGIAAGMIVKAADPAARDDLRGSIARSGFYQGEPVRREKLIKGANSGFMSAILPSGKRAVAINIDSQGSTTAGGFVLPNDRVDVVRTTQQTGVLGAAGAAPFVSDTILRNIRVLAIGQNVQDKNGQPVVVGSNATLELDPVQAEAVILAQRAGQLSLTLRSLQDASKETDEVQKSEDGNLTVVRYGVTSQGTIR